MCEPKTDSVSVRALLVGAITLLRTPCGARSSANALLIPSIAHFDAQ